MYLDLNGECAWGRGRTRREGGALKARVLEKRQMKSEVQVKRRRKEGDILLRGNFDFV